MPKYKNQPKKRFAPSRTKFRHRPQLGLNFGFDIRNKGLLAYTAEGGILGPLVTDKGEPILF